MKESQIEYWKNRFKNLNQVISMYQEIVDILFILEDNARSMTNYEYDRYYSKSKSILKDINKKLTKGIE